MQRQRDKEGVWKERRRRKRREGERRGTEIKTGGRKARKTKIVDLAAI